MKRGALFLMLAAISFPAYSGPAMEALKNWKLRAQNANQTELGTAEGYLHPESIANGLGVYGNPAASLSIRNVTGAYGSPTGALSAYNPAATAPPIIRAYAWPYSWAYVTKNKNITSNDTYFSGLIDPDELIAYFASHEDEYLDGPNLTPFVSGWSMPLEIFCKRGTTKSYTFTDRDTIYAQFGAGNAGNADLDGPFSVALYVDGKRVYQAAITRALTVGDFLIRSDCSFGPLTPGIHTVTVEVDSGRQVNELFETDNRYTRTIRVDRSSAAGAVWTLYE